MARVLELVRRTSGEAVPPGPNRPAVDGPTTTRSVARAARRRSRSAHPAGRGGAPSVWMAPLLVSRLVLVPARVRRV